MNRIVMTFGAASILVLSGVASAEQPLTVGQMDAITAGNALGNAWSSAAGDVAATWTGVITGTQVTTIVIPPLPGGTPTTIYVTQSGVNVGATALAQSVVATGAAGAGSIGNAVGTFTSFTASDGPIGGATTNADVAAPLPFANAATHNFANASSFGPGGPATASSSSVAAAALF